MTLLTSRCAFVHIPKTGGQWVAAALRGAELVRDEVGPVHASPDELAGDPRWAHRDVVFAIVRHPLAWYQSMWAHRMQEAWDAVDDPEWFSSEWVERWKPLSDECRSNDFATFVARCLDRFPDGWVSDLFRRYTDGCTAIGRQEHLSDDLVRILRDGGEVFDESSLRRTPEQNTRAQTPEWRARAKYPPGLALRVVETEEGAIERFGYCDYSLAGYLDR